MSEAQSAVKEAHEDTLGVKGDDLKSSQRRLLKQFSQQRVLYASMVVSLILIIINGVLVYRLWFTRTIFSNVPENLQLEFDVKEVSPEQDVTPDPAHEALKNDIPYINPDPLGAQLTSELRFAGYNLGFIHSQVLKDKNISIPVTPNPRVVNDPSLKPPVSLDAIIPRPAPEESKVNLLEYPNLKISAPIQYTTFEDLFGTKPDGSLDFFTDAGSKNYGADSPVQTKLKDGVVHLAFSPFPGEVGNSYIIGHSSNYSWVRSNYNTIFAPLVSSNIGDEFIIYDPYGRRLVFSVFEKVVIREHETGVAYKNLGDKRVVTLQASVLENVNGVNLPTKRLLVRGELKL